MSTGKDVTEFSRPVNTQTRLKLERQVLITYLLLLATQVPLSGLYLWSIWNERPHYAALPIAFIAFGLFVYLRWPRSGDVKFFGSFKSDFFLIAGVILGVTGSLLLSPWFGFAAFLLMLASLLARTNDRVD